MNSGMTNIAILDDEAKDSHLLERYLKLFFSTRDDAYEIHIFSDPFLFLGTLSENYDVIFLDIDMPDLNGLAVAKRVREISQEVALVFVTNLAQYALNSYEYAALDYLVKPVDYPLFDIKMRKVMDYLSKLQDVMIPIQTDEKLLILPLQSILYFQVQGHSIFYRTDKGNFLVRNSLKNVLSSLPPHRFGQCNRNTCVNLSRLTSFQDDRLMLGSLSIAVSRRFRKSFMIALMNRLSPRS
jgi:DNA-binding LytR/AlgR family response regulator